MLSLRDKIKTYRKQQKVIRTAVSVSAGELGLSQGDQVALDRLIKSRFQSIENSLTNEHDNSLALLKTGALSQELINYVNDFSNEKRDELVKLVDKNYGFIYEEYFKKKLKIANKPHKSVEFNNIDDFLSVVSSDAQLISERKNDLLASEAYKTDIVAYLTRMIGAYNNIIMNPRLYGLSTKSDEVKTVQLVKVKNIFQKQTVPQKEKERYYVHYLASKVYKDIDANAFARLVNAGIKGSRENFEIDTVKKAKLTQVSDTESNIVIKLGEIKSNFSYNGLYKGIIQLLSACAYLSFACGDVYNTQGITYNKRFELNLYISIGETNEERRREIKTTISATLNDIPSTIKFAPNTSLTLKLYEVLENMHKQDIASMSQEILFRYP